MLRVFVCGVWNLKENSPGCSFLILQATENEEPLVENILKSIKISSSPARISVYFFNNYSYKQQKAIKCFTSSSSHVEFQMLHVRFQNTHVKLMLLAVCNDTLSTTHSEI
jgi:hypothetical protein